MDGNGEEVVMVHYTHESELGRHIPDGGTQIHDA